MLTVGKKAKCTKVKMKKKTFVTYLSLSNFKMWAKGKLQLFFFQLDISSSPFLK